MRNLTARKVAIKLIRKYVLRGDTLEQIREQQGGQFTPGPTGYSVEIGGYRKGKRIGLDWIVITQLNGRPYFKKFKLIDIFRAIKRGAK